MQFVGSDDDAAHDLTMQVFLVLKQHILNHPPAKQKMRPLLFQQEWDSDSSHHSETS